jgi:hypothetical protein
MEDRPRRSTRPALPAPPPPSSDPRVQRRDLLQTAPELPVSRSRPSPPGQQAQVATAPSEGPSRREIKTVPGGGLNRISDGRAAASAYVGVKSLGGSPRPAPVTFSKVKLARDLLVENKEFRTEPALRSQSLPPPPVQSRVTPVSARRTMFSPRGSPQAVVAVVAMLAVTVGVLVVVATGGRWVMPHGSNMEAEVVQWDHGIDGQPGELAPPLAPPSAPQGEVAGQPADVGPPARSADLEEEPADAVVAPARVTSRSTTSRAGTSTSQSTSRSDTTEQVKVDPEAETTVASTSQKPTRSTRTPSEQSASAQAAPSQPSRAPPQPWLE